LSKTEKKLSVSFNNKQLSVLLEITPVAGTVPRQIITIRLSMDKIVSSVREIILDRAKKI
jgi:hypothetical protein